MTDYITARLIGGPFDGTVERVLDVPTIKKAAPVKPLPIPGMLEVGASQASVTTHVYVRERGTNNYRYQEPK